MTEPDGKSKWFAVDARGHRASIAAKAASFVLPGSGYAAADLEKFTKAAAEADASILELAWAIAAEDDGSGGGGGGSRTSGTVGKPLSLQELASLLFDSEGALEVWTTYWLLLNDRVFFKQSVSGIGGYCMHCWG